MKKQDKIYDAAVLECRPENSDSEAFLLRLDLGRNDFLADAGQFIALSPGSATSVMPRPFTIVEASGSELSILFRVAGKNTEAYSRLEEGDRIQVFGPQGMGISFDPKIQKCIFIGGGIGGAALVAPVQKAKSEGREVMVYLGAKKKSQLAGMSFFAKLGVDVKTITETDSEKIGFVTDLLEETLRNDGGASQVIACGPKFMLRRVSEICKKYGNACLVIVEEMMACGMGACKGCAIFGGEDGKEVKHVCSDGPTFDAYWIDWEKFAPLPGLIRVTEKEAPAEVDFTCHLGPLTLKYPFLNASGTLDLTALEDGSVDTKGIGAIVVKGLSLYERRGNAAPRVCETPSGMLNSIGLEYIGIDRFLKEALPRLLEFGIPIIVNINGESQAEYQELAVRLAGTGIAALEVNISCPNVKKGGIAFGTDPLMAGEVTAGVKRVADVPVIVKLSPNVSDIRVIARAVEDAGADIISLINTLIGLVIDIKTCRPKLANIFGGLSGPAIRPVAMRMVRQVFETVSVPTIGMGGNENGYTAAEFMMAGATATALGTSGFADRRIFKKAIGQLGEVAINNGFSATRQLVGCMIKE